MQIIARAALILIVFVAAGAVRALAAAETFVVAPPPTGNDTNDCLSSATPCATVQHASELCANRCTIQLMNGRYENQSVDVIYYKVVSIIGNCSDPSQVIVTKTAGAIFSAQDHAILTVECLETQTTGNHTVGFQTRQFAIMDLDRIRHGYMPLGTHIAANEKSKINCAGDNWIIPNSSGNAGAANHVSVSGQSQVIMNCHVSAIGTATFDAFASVRSQSYLDASSLRWGGGSIVGSQYNIDGHSEIDGAAKLPGQGRVDLTQ